MRDIMFVMRKQNCDWTDGMKGDKVFTKTSLDMFKTENWTKMTRTINAWQNFYLDNHK